MSASEDYAGVERRRDVIDPFDGIDMDDPRAVARALAAVGMRAGAEASTLAHMHERIGRALEEFTRATDALGKLATREDLENRMADLERRMDERRLADRRAAVTRGVALLAAGLIVLAVVLGFIWFNRQANLRNARQLDEFSKRQEDTAICTRTNGDEPTILECIATRTQARRER